MSFTRKLIYPFAVIAIGLYFLFTGLIASKNFLAPIVTAIVLALLMIPVSNKMDSWDMKRSLSSFFSTLFLMFVSLLIASLVFFQIKNFVDDREAIKEAMGPKLEQIEKYIVHNTNLEQVEIDAYKEKSDITTMLTNTKSGKTAVSILGLLVGFFTNSLLMFAYILFLPQYRKTFKKFILKLFSEERQQKVRGVIEKTATISQHYLFGRCILMIILAILYSIGLGLSGGSNFILISLIAAVLSLIPFVGNIIGLFIALTFGNLTTGETSVLIGVIITFTIAQIIDSYFLQPYVLGSKVNIHPLFIIIVVILGNAVWGIIGMAFAIPVLGIINSAFSHMEKLEPLGYLLSNPKED